MHVCRQDDDGETTFPSFKLESCEHCQHNLLVHVEVADKFVKADASKKQRVA
jgi:hypothetical protein